MAGCCATSGIRVESSVMVIRQ